MDHLNLWGGWVGILLGVVSGALIGLFFHQEDWLGGYDSYRRRLLRLGHISFFGLGFVNLFFGLTIHLLHLSGPQIDAASWCFIVGAISMPVCCFLSAWRKPFRHLFPVPVGSVLIGVILLLLAWPYG